MQLFRHYQGLPVAVRGAVIAIGSFDGVHRGHQAVIGKARRLALEFEAPSGVVTFEPHPRRFLQPKLPPFLLTSFRVKTRLIQSLGVDALYALPFNQRMAKLTAEEFAYEVLAEGLAVKHVVVGDDFRFGARRLGDVALLTQLGRQHGFGVTTVRPVLASGQEPYSSTQVRQQLMQGKPTRAALLLGRYWEIEGRVLHGAKRGRGLGYPTANIGLGEILRPAFGVYAVRAALDRAGQRWLAGVANIGISPMFDPREPLLEVHLFDFDGDLYGKHLRVALVDYLREERVFESIDAMKRQMDEDSSRAKVTLAWEDWDSTWPASPFMAVGADTGGP
ncbi:MAG TPA: bifunctional riboflavin kinase/FAD synthetase [Kiloniellales bacterium]|nr:bifunctional riboflavin kinase/FAD synthetase [Kiloniellales bacterium]